MAGRGPLPKAPAARQRRNAAGQVELSAAPVDAPDLPCADLYSERTQTWYRTWATSPQAALFSPTDWQRLHMLAPLVERYFVEPSQQLMAEIRQNESKLGATPEDRERLHWRIASPGEDEPEPEAQPRRRPDPRRKPAK